MIIRRGEQELVSFSSNDYLGLSQHPEAVAAANLATSSYGTGAGASRLVTGNHPLYRQLETALAKWKGEEAACVFGSGYLTNLGVIGALMGKEDIILADKLSHACLLDGALLSGATVRRFVHNDVDSCRKLLKEKRNNYGNCLLVTEAVFSMDGDLAPLAALAALAAEYDAWLLVDEAHALFGSRDWTAEGRSVIRTGTLSKALGSYGGYVCGSQALIAYLQTAARSLIYSTALPPGVLAAALAALAVEEREPQRAKKALENAQCFTRLMGLPPAQSAIVPLVIGEESRAMHLSAALQRSGYLVAAIRPPTVPPGTARLRFTFSASHTQSQLHGLVEALKKQMEGQAA